MEDYGYKYTNKLSHIVITWSSRKNCLIGLILKTTKISDFLTILYSKPLREHKKPKFKSGVRIRISKYDLPFRKRYRLQFTQEIYENVGICSRKTPTNIKKDEHDEIIGGKFYQRELITVI